MINENHIRRQQYLAALYQLTPTCERKKNTMAETYGEILVPSVTKLLSQLALTEEDIFIDFGSGIGKIVAQVFLQTQIKAAYGIEIVPEFHQQAIKISETIQQDFPQLFNDRKLQFINEDFLQASLPLATFAIINATCFSQKLLCDLGVLINHMPKMHTVFTLRPIATLQRLVFKKTLQVECSWDSVLCYLYGLK